MSFQTSFEGKERKVMMKSERERIPGLYSRETEGMATMLFSFESGDAKSSLIWSGRRPQRPRTHSRTDINLDKVSQVLRDSASKYMIAETGCSVFDFLLYGEPVQLFKERFSRFCSMRLTDELNSSFVLAGVDWKVDSLLAGNCICSRLI